MAHLPPYIPSLAYGAHVRKAGDKWTLILIRDLRHAPALVWQALTDPEQLRAWAPFDVAGDLSTPGAPLTLTWTGTGQITEAKVTRADAPRLLEFADIRWELEPTGTGTRLTLWHNIDRRFIAWGAAGWHICLDVLDTLLSGTPIGRIAGPDAMQSAGWQKLVAEYATRFDLETQV